MSAAHTTEASDEKGFLAARVITTTPGLSWAHLGTTYIVYRLSSKHGSNIRLAVLSEVNR